MDKKDLSRRDFLKLSAAAAAIGVVAPSTLAAEGKAGGPALEYRVLGRTGIKVTTVSLGCMVAPEQVIAKAFDIGINWFDTAHSYKRGTNEEEVARATKGGRDRIHICTKVGFGTPEVMQQRLDLSLQRLGTDHVDLLLTHGASSRDAVMKPETVAFLEKARKDGKTRFIGTSTHKNMADVINAVVEAKVYDAVLTTFNFQVGKDVIDAVAAAKAANVGVIAMKTQAPVVAMMKKAREQGQEATLPIAAPEGYSLHQAALKWALDNPAIACAVPGTRDLQQLDSNIAVMGKRLSYFDKRRLEKIAEVAAQSYCVGCGACNGMCPHGVSVPDVRRSAMYLNGYGEEGLAKDTYRELQANAARCADCASCAVRCMRGTALQPILSETHSRLA